MLAPQAVQKVRKYYRFSDAARDVVDARIYLGIHFRFADVAARTQGRSVADWTFNHFLLPLEGRDHHGHNRCKATMFEPPALVLFAALATSARADVIMDWNARADAIATDKRVLPPIHGRALAMMHVAMFEAVNSIERRYVPYRLKLVADRNTSGETAAAVAGHDVLVALYPDQKSGLDALLAETLNRVRGGARQGARHHPRPQSGGGHPRAARARMAATWRRPIDPSRSRCVRAHCTAGRVDGRRFYALGHVERRRSSVRRRRPH